MKSEKKSIFLLYNKSWSFFSRTDFMSDWVEPFSSRVPGGGVGARGRKWATQSRVKSVSEKTHFYYIEDDIFF